MTRTIELQGKTYVYHHSASRQGYCRRADEGTIETYNGKFGEGIIKVVGPYKNSGRYTEIEYYIYDPDYRKPVLQTINLHEQRIKVLKRLREFCADPNNSYNKRAFFGSTGLYLCHKGYGHADYNKWRAMDIQGNEDFCAKVVAICDRIENR